MTFRQHRALASAAVRAAIAFTLVAALALIFGRPAHADNPSLAGAWNMSAVTETFTVQRWSAPCGPPPVSRASQTAGTATVRPDGSELVIDTSTRSYRTDQCLDTMTTLSRDAHSGDGRTWRTRCSTSASDPRRASVNAAYFLTGNSTITVAETGRYEFMIEGARCVADVARQASLHRVGNAPPAPSGSDSPSPAQSAHAAAGPGAGDSVVAPHSDPATKVDCSAPGDAVRLEVRPSRKLLRFGDTFGFRATVLDTSFCPTTTAVHWSLSAIHLADGSVSSLPLSIDAGKLTIPKADTSDATFDVIATANGRSARASVEVTSAAHYEALLAQSGLDPNGEQDEPAVAVLATNSLGASNALVEDSARHRRLLFIAIIAGLALILGVVAVFGAVRARRAHALEAAATARHAEKMRDYDATKLAREREHAAQMRAHIESVAMAEKATASAARRGPTGPITICPSCRREFSDGSIHCPFDGSRLVSSTGGDTIPAGPAGGVCPTCGGEFNPGVRICPQDGDRIVPMPLAAPPPVVSRGKICPTCGDRFDGAAAFCGKDGTQLVLLN